MRVAIIADPLDNQRAGVHVYTREFLRALHRLQPKADILLIRSRHSDEFPRFQERVIPNTTVPVGWASFRLFVLIPWVCRRWKADMVMEPAHFGPFTLPKRVKRITMIHDLTPITLPHYHRWHSAILQRWFLPGILRKADLILSNSQSTTQSIVDYQPLVRDNITTIPLGVESRFKPTNQPDILATYGIAEPYWLYMGTLEPRKNLMVLLEAYRHYRQSGGTTNLVLAGGMGWKMDAFRKVLEAHPFRADIILTGFVPDDHQPALYSHCRAFVYPSLQEGFGLPVAEAMACGAPVITTQVSSLPEVGGEVALYINADGVNELVGYWRRLDADDDWRRSLSAQGVQQAARFSWDAYAVAWWQAVQKLA